jgi:predicted Zn-dependent protease
MSKFLLNILLFLTLASCVTNPLGRSQLSLLPGDQLTQMGLQAFSEIKQETPIETNQAINTYVNCVVKSLLRAFQHDGTPWEVVVFRSDEVNAFALPGGKIGVYTGLLSVANSQHQLAAVLGHEISHVLLSHGGERMSQDTLANVGMVVVGTVLDTNTQSGKLTMAALGLGAQVGVLLPYGRLQETESDRLGLEIMARAGFDPRESVTLWQNMAKASGSSKLEFLSTHPAHQTRIDALRAQMNYALKLSRQSQAGGWQPNCHL